MCSDSSEYDTPMCVICSFFTGAQVCSAYRLASERRNRKETNWHAHTHTQTHTQTLCDCFIAALLLRAKVKPEPVVRWRRNPPHVQSNVTSCHLSVVQRIIYDELDASKSLVDRGWSTFYALSMEQKGENVEKRKNSIYVCRSLWSVIDFGVLLHFVAIIFGSMINKGISMINKARIVVQCFCLIHMVAHSIKWLLMVYVGHWWAEMVGIW